MTGFLGGAKKLGSRTGKGFLIEMYMEYYPQEVAKRLKIMLDTAGITREDVRRFVVDNQALPIPEKAFVNMQGLEDYLATIKPGRVFKWLLEARPDLAEELINLGDVGAEYIVKLKKFIIDSIKALDLPPGEKEEEAKHVTPEQEEESGQQAVRQEGLQRVEESSQDPLKTKKVTCTNCGYERLGTPEEAESWSQEACPNCGEK